jgi:hypothetical protein
MAGAPALLANLVAQAADLKTFAHEWDFLGI